MIWNPSSGAASALVMPTRAAAIALPETPAAICGAEHARRRHGFGHGFGEQPFLRAEVAIDQHRGDAGATRDLADAGAGVAGLGEGPARGLQNGLAGGSCVALPLGSGESLAAS